MTAPDPGLLAAVEATRRRESRQNPQECNLPDGMLQPMLGFAEFCGERLGLKSLPEIRFFIPRPIDVHSGVWLSGSRTVWVAAFEGDGETLRPGRAIARTLAHELAHAAGHDDEPTCYRFSDVAIHAFEALPTAPLNGTVPRAAQYFGV